MENNLMTEWKKNCIRIGAPTNLLAAATAFIPVLWLCATYDCWPALNTVLTAWGMVALSFGMSGTYLSFLSGNIGNMRVPVAAMALDSTASQPGTLQAEVASTMAICGSIITNLVFTTLAAIIGAAVVSILPAFIVTALTKYAAAAIFGGTFGNFAIKYPKIAIFAIGIPFVLKMTTGLPAWVLIVASVFGSLAVARFFYTREHRAA